MGENVGLVSARPEQAALADGVPGRTRDIEYLLRTLMIALLVAAAAAWATGIWMYARSTNLVADEYLWLIALTPIGPTKWAVEGWRFVRPDLVSQDGSAGHLLLCISALKR